MITFVRGKFRFLLALFLIGLYFLLAIPLYPIIYISPYKGKKIVSHLVSLLSSLILFVMKVKVTYKGEVDRNKNYFIVANHLSYVDILLISKKIPTVFVTSMEMKATPILGQITDLAGCLYVERRSRENINEEVKDITQAMRAGLNVTVFPEATSTDGEGMLKFKRSLYESAVDAPVEVLPITLNYKKLNQKPITRANRDYLYWYADMTFADHLFKLCHKSTIDVDVMIHSPLNKSSDGAKLRDESYQIIKETYIPLST